VIALENQIRRKSLIKGLYLGAILLVLSILSYYLIISMPDKAWLIVFSPIIFSVFIPILIVLLLCFNLRKNIGGYWTLRQAVTGIFIMFVISYVVQVVGRDVVFARLIEPDMVNKTQIAMSKATTVMLQKSGASQATINEKQADIQKQLDDQKNITIGGIIQGYVITIIFLFVFAVIFGALLRRNPPEYLVYSDDAE
jgi:hypothetical protein